MRKDGIIKPPFFEIGPKNYLYGDKVIELAKIADEASAKYGVDVIFTSPFLNLRSVVEATENIFVFAPAMDNIPIGRGYTSILPEAVKAEGASGVMLNHSEHPLTVRDICALMKRAEQLELQTVICGDSVNEVRMAAMLNPTAIIAEPEELIGAESFSDFDYVRKSVKVIKDINPDIYVLIGAGVSCGEDVYGVISNGADASGSSSHIAKAQDMKAVVEDMLAGARRAWDERNK